MHNPINTVIAFVLLVAAVGGSFYYIYSTQPYLGVEGREVTPAIAKVLGLQEAKGILISQVKAGSPAEHGGLKGGDKIANIDGQEMKVGGDVITGIDGIPIQGVDDAESLLATKKIGDSVKFTIIRDTAVQEITVVIGGGG